jgi:hypothetical protein
LIQPWSVGPVDDDDPSAHPLNDRTVDAFEIGDLGGRVSDVIRPPQTPDNVCIAMAGCEVNAPRIPA